MLDRFFSKREKVHHTDLDFPEVEIEKYHNVKVIKMRETTDISEIKSALSRTDVLFVDVGNFKKPEDLKRAISRMKLISARYGGEVLGLNDRWIMITTSAVVLER